jgi:hypothetical protein
MTRRFRIALAFLVAPVAPALLFTLIVALADGPLAGLALGFYAILLNAMVGYPVALAVGLPLYFIFSRRRWTRLGVYLGAGLALGAAIGAVVAVRERLGEPSSLAGAIFVVIGGGLGGLVVALCFWLVARPARD